MTSTTPSLPGTRLSLVRARYWPAFEEILKLVANRGWAAVPTLSCPPIACGGRRSRSEAKTTRRFPAPRVQAGNGHLRRLPASSVRYQSPSATVAFVGLVISIQSSCPLVSSRRPVTLLARNSLITNCADAGAMARTAAARKPPSQPRRPPGNGVEFSSLTAGSPPPAGSARLWARSASRPGILCSNVLREWAAWPRPRSRCHRQRSGAE